MFGGRHLKRRFSCTWCSLNVLCDHQISAYTRFSSTVFGWWHDICQIYWKNHENINHLGTLNISGKTNYNFATTYLFSDLLPLIVWFRYWFPLYIVLRVWFHWPSTFHCNFILPELPGLTKNSHEHQS